jgi:hypothetical protein
MDLRPAVTNRPSLCTEPLLSSAFQPSVFRHGPLSPTHFVPRSSPYRALRSSPASHPAVLPVSPYSSCANLSRSDPLVGWRRLVLWPVGLAGTPGTVTQGPKFSSRYRPTSECCPALCACNWRTRALKRELHVASVKTAPRLCLQAVSVVGAHSSATPSHLHTATPSHLRTFTPSHLRTFAPSHLRTFTLPYRHTATPHTGYIQSRHDHHRHTSTPKHTHHITTTTDAHPRCYTPPYSHVLGGNPVCARQVHATNLHPGRHCRGGVVDSQQPWRRLLVRVCFCNMTVRMCMCMCM